MSITTSRVEAVAWVAVIAGLSGGVCKPLLRPETRLWPPDVLLEGYVGGHNLKAALLPNVLRSSAAIPAQTSAA